MKIFQQQIQETEKEIHHLENQIIAEREKLGGHDATANNIAIQKQIRVLENRLDKALIKFNKSLATNKNLRDIIDNLRRERAVFESIYRKQERELMEQKKAMADIIENSNNSYESRDEAQAKMIALKEKAEKEFVAYTQEIKELDRVLEQDRKFKQFMAIKSAARSGSGNISSNLSKAKNTAGKIISKL
jgi:chromosome segregation ATPase